MNKTKNNAIGKKFFLWLSIFLAFFSFLILLFSLNYAGVFNFLTGHATDTGTANLTIQSAASISFITNNINWGSGHVDEIPTFAVLDTSLNGEAGGVINGTWTNASGLVLQNDGNSNVSLTIMTGKNATNFIGGASPTYKIRVRDNEANSCYGIGTKNNYTLYDFTEADTSNQQACNYFRFEDSDDSVIVDVQLHVPEDALPTAKSDIITATATVV